MLLLLFLQLSFLILPIRNSVNPEELGPQR